MQNRIRHAVQSGFTYIELIVVTAIMLLIFGAVLVSFQYALELGQVSRVKVSAVSLANDRMEFFRSLPYDDVGLVASFPVGLIPQTSTFNLNGFEITEEIWVDYEDDPADGEDGTGTPDSNDIAQDYKLIKALYTWTVNERTNSLSLVSTIVPRSIETNVGAGTIRINVLDADNTLLQNASVQIVGSNPGFPYDVTRPSTADGTALFSVPADSDYQAFVTANIGGRQYSTSSTYFATTDNPNPTVIPFAVSEGGISTQTFTIGELSDLLVTTLSSLVEASALETFADTNAVAVATNVVVAGDELVLEDTAGVYEPTGVVYLNPIEPAAIEQWETIRVVADVPVGTSYMVQLYTGSSTNYTLVPDADLPGNSSGLFDTLIDLSALDVTAYPTTTVAVSLFTTDTSVTPVVQEIETYWRASESARSNTSLFVRGDKIIGTDASSAPIYKSTETIVTDTNGERQLNGIEFDTYIATSSVYSLASACPAHPYIVPAGSDTELELLFVSGVTNSARVSVVDGLGRAIPGASVQLTRAGYDVSQTTNTCGQTFFSGGGLGVHADYDINVSAPGYAGESIDSFSIDGEMSVTITLS